MKRFFICILTAIIVIACFSSCKANLPKRIDSFVTSVEKHADSYSKEDWDKANEKFKKMVDEFRQNKDSYNSEEKKMVNAAISRYAKAVAKSGINDAINFVTGVTSEVGSAIGSFLDELGLSSGNN